VLEGSFPSLSSSICGSGGGERVLDESIAKGAPLKKPRKEEEKKKSDKLRRSDVTAVENSRETPKGFQHWERGDGAGKSPCVPSFQY